MAQTTTSTHGTITSKFLLRSAASETRSRAHSPAEISARQQILSRRSARQRMLELGRWWMSCLTGQQMDRFKYFFGWIPRASPHPNWGSLGIKRFSVLTYVHPRQMRGQPVPWLSRSRSVLPSAFLAGGDCRSQVGPSVVYS